MRRADRLLDIIQILRRHRTPVAGDVIANELEVSLRTIYRDIQTLIAQGVPIRGEAGVGYILEDGYDLPPLMFKVDEIEALILGLLWVKRRGDNNLVRAAEDAMAKIETIVPPNLKSSFDEISLVAPPNFDIVADNIDVSQIRKAIREKWKITFDYLNAESNATKRTIHPFAISYFEKQRLVIGWCELRIEYRAFRTDRMENLAIEPEKYRTHRKQMLKEWIEVNKRRNCET
jgi:predicted DNA-binding transcriptional regulator YafY